MQTDYIIVGQGICGTMLSWFLHKEGKSFIIFDETCENSSSKIAAGILNPVTGRRYAYTWLIEQVMPFALQVYEEMGRYFNSRFISEKSIIDFFPTPQMRNAFLERLTENDTYLHTFPDQNKFNQFFTYDFGCGEISPAYIVHLQELMEAWRRKLLELKMIREEKLDENEIKISEDGISYNDITAQKIIFCEGIPATANHWFHMLPFAPNKGEAITIECRDLNNEHVFKKGLMLAPLQEKNFFWVGSNYQWEFANDRPSAEFLEHVQDVLNGWLKFPYKIISHTAAIRPATIERRPFAGFHPLNKNIGILNGMGTKGASLAPFFALQMVQHLIHKLPIDPLADISRFNGILSRG